MKTYKIEIDEKELNLMKIFMRDNTQTKAELLFTISLFGIIAILVVHSLVTISLFASLLSIIFMLGAVLWSARYWFDNLKAGNSLYKKIKEASK